MRLIDEAKDRLRKRERDAARTKPTKAPGNEATAQIRAQVIQAPLTPISVLSAMSACFGVYGGCHVLHFIENLIRARRVDIK